MFIVSGEKQISDEEIHKRDFEWLSQSDGKCCNHLCIESIVYCSVLHIRCSSCFVFVPNEIWVVLCFSLLVHST